MNLATSLAAAPPEPKKPELVVNIVTLIPTGSKTDRLLACTWWVGRRVAIAPVGERTRFGSAFHEMLASFFQGRAPTATIAWKKCAKKWDVDDVELSDRVREARPIITRWLEGKDDNHWKINFSRGKLLIEKAMAYDPEADRAREIDPPTEDTHEYKCDEGEIPMSADIIGVVTREFSDGSRRRILLVEDHKSGWNVAQFWQDQTPGESGQLRTLALAADRLYGPFDQIIVAYFHARAGGVPVVLADELTRSDLEAHRKQLRAAVRNIGKGWLRPGPWCAHCPAFSLCPAQTNALIELKRTGPLTAARVGEIHQATQLYDALREQLRQEIRSWLRLHGTATRPDGRPIELVEKTVARLSQASIIRALGQLKGKKEIERLRRLGCIDEKPQEEIRVGGAR